MHHTMRFSRSVLLLAGMLTLGVGTLQAQTDIFTSANGNWNTTGNWSLGSLPTPSTPVTLIGALVPGFTYPSNAVANVNNGDSLTCSNLYIGYSANGVGGTLATGTLNIAGGTLLVTGTNFCGAGTGNGTYYNCGGVITQTGGVMTNLGPVYLTYGAGTGAWTVAGGTLVTMGGFTIGHFGGSGNLTISGLSLVFDCRSRFDIGKAPRAFCDAVEEKASVLW